MTTRKLIPPTLLLLIFFTGCVKPDEPVRKDVVINELLPVNRTVAADQDGQYDDWIEIYNKASGAKDISGYFLSDNEDKPEKWKFPEGTVVAGKGYLVVWADGDTLQAGLHTNFKLSSAGEEVVFTSPNGTLLDDVIYPPVTEEDGWARNPDGTGEFRWQTPTFDRSNNIE